MTAVYAKIRSSVQFFFALSLLVMLSGCGGGGGLSGYTPWNMSSGKGVVTNDPHSVPNIAWQTPVQRETLNRQSELFAQGQTASEQGQPPAAAPAQEQAAAAPAAAPSKVKVALLLPLTGKGGDLGQAMLKAAQMALFDVGSANIELVPRDTKSTSDGAALAARQALNEHADLILGPLYSEDLRAVRAVTGSSGTPVVSFSTDWTQAGNGTYIMGFMPFAQVMRAVQFAQGKGYNKFAVYAPQTEYCDVVVSTLQRTGANVVRVARYAPQQSDLPSLVKDFVATSRTGDSTNAAGVNFDALLLPVGGEGAKLVSSLLDGEGVSADKVKFIGTGLWDDAAMNSTPALYGGWYAAPDPQLRADFEKRYEENYGSPAPRLSSLAYDATALAAVLAHTGDGTEPAYSRERLTNPRGFAGIDGIFRFRPDGLPERGLAVLEIRQGKSRVVDPAPTAFFASGS